jgi:hypothetical protein
MKRFRALFAERDNRYCMPWSCHGHGRKIRILSKLLIQDFGASKVLVRTGMDGDSKVTAKGDILLEKIVQKLNLE